jgi:rSAM/selenodomain-associated transferase 1
MKKALLIFAKNLIYGKIKTRLAATAGDQKAFNIYKDLLHYTQQVTQSLANEKIIFYSDYIEQQDIWSRGFQKQVQQGADLGERMQHAFNWAFANNHKEVVIIGTDCFELTSSIINKAFSALMKYDVVIGPALDGGYYLLGMKKMYPGIFQHISWSSEKVLSQTIAFCKDQNLSYLLLEELSDLDDEKDLEKMMRRTAKII